MEYIDYQCPYCKGELKIPKHPDAVLCMYCGKQITLQKTSGEAKEGQAEESFAKAMAGISLLLKDREDLLADFKQESYERAFYGYLRECRPVLEALEDSCQLRQEKASAWQNQAAEALVSFAKEHASGRDAKEKMNQYKTVLALYTVPMIGELKLSISDSFADSIVTAWTAAFPKYFFKKGTFASLKEGFSLKKRLGCFITSAVCRTMDKPDDCYELTAFRQFRDEYLKKEPDGEALIERYYEVAPRIVEVIDERKDCQEIYSAIWEDYLSNCLEYIEEGKYSACRALYIEMVQDLEKEYLV